MFDRRNGGYKVYELPYSGIATTPAKAEFAITKSSGIENGLPENVWGSVLLHNHFGGLVALTANIDTGGEVVGFDSYALEVDGSFRPLQLDGYPRVRSFLR